MKSYKLPETRLDSYSFSARNSEENYVDQSMKQKVDHQKELISTIPRKSWTRAVHFTNPYEQVPRKYPRKISRAYFKIREILKDFDLEHSNLDNINTLHLCEGPGGFIEAIIELRKKQNKNINWTGITLKNENNDPNLPDFMNEFDKNCITYGIDNTGDLTNVENIKYLGVMFEQKGLAHLVTADGGFDVSNDHCSQEHQSYKLFLCQVVSAMECQILGGSFVMKIFDCYSNNMIDLLHILSIHYSEVHITKPYSSRPCNSEKYVVCKGFKGITQKEKKLLCSLIENYENITIMQKPNTEFIQCISKINNTLSSNQYNALIDTIGYATKEKWIKKPQDMSDQFIYYYL